MLEEAEAEGKGEARGPKGEKVGEESERQEEKGCGNEEPGGVWGAQGEETALGAAGSPAVRLCGAKNREPGGWPGEPAPE